MPLPPALRIVPRAVGKGGGIHRRGAHRANRAGRRRPGPGGRALRGRAGLLVDLGGRLLDRSFLVNLGGRLLRGGSLDGLGGCVVRGRGGLLIHLGGRLLDRGFRVGRGERVLHLRGDQTLVGHGVIRRVHSGGASCLPLGRIGAGQAYLHRHAITQV
ncbi:MAG TPA: hypothetical protein DCX12_00850 [Chloroflexi bacterium]|nr:hypothetical protein [Chloroflexota bacterium]HBV93333.1 hypothetical protein [Chloroflexota bacterium]